MSDTSTSDVEQDGTLVRVHTHTGKEGVIVELRPPEHDIPRERDMQDLTDSEALDLYRQLGDYLRDPDRSERPCPDCGGRQVLTSVGSGDAGEFIKAGEEWICTDTQCDRRDRYSGTEMERSENTDKSGGDST